MGLRDRFKQAGNVGKNAKWRLGSKPVVITLEDNHIHMEMGGGEINIFYKDIQQIEKLPMSIKINTIAQNYHLTTMRIKGGADLANELYAELYEKVYAENTPTQTNNTGESPSFCGNCGQALNGENFCPSCGTEIKKL